CTPAVADSAREDHRRIGEAGAHRPRHSDETVTRAGSPMTRIHGTFIAAALALSAVVLSAGAAQQAPPSQEAPPPAPQPAPAQPGRPAPPAQQPSFRVGVELVSLNVTVTDGANRYVTDLEEGDFQVYEDGVKQEVTL